MSIPRILYLHSALLLFMIPLQAQDTTAWKPDRAFNLGEILVTALRPLDTANVITSVHIERFNTIEASKALNLLPGITLANVGPRNESVVYVRGFDLRQVPVFIDGIPVYVPYDGYVDLARFTTTDLAHIQVDKGYSSVLYGANTMGGAINLVSRKPARKLEYDGRLGIMSGKGQRINLNLGSRLDKFYFQGGFSYLERTTFPMSEDFKAVASEDGGDRNNAFRKDLKINVKMGFTPNETDEYAIGYVRQDGEKGNPPYTGNDPNIRVRYWQWPYWDKESIYFLSNTQVGVGSRMKVRLYYDRFENVLFSYDDDTYSAQTRPYAFQSYYDDYSYGGNAEFSTTLLPKNEVKLAAYFKHDTHRENNLGEPQRTMADNTISFALEDEIRLAQKWRIIPGVSYNIRNSQKAQDYLASEGLIVDFPDNDNSAFNLQTALVYQPASGQSLRASVARKTRFATLKDRYSYRLGQAIPNPELEAEAAVHYELAYLGQVVKDKLSLQVNLFYTNLVNAIQQVDNVQGNQFQLQNTGEARFAGTEISIDYKPGDFLQTGINYSYIEQENLTRPEILFTNVPKHKIFAFANGQIASWLSLLISTEYNTERFSTSYGTKAEAFTLANFALHSQIQPWLGLNAGVNNVFDKNYALVEGFPEEGRNYFVTISFKRP
ncbi:MAG: TonB-dependent receptor plug domain-containing protein [Saprospiraceae bacterium]